MNRSHFSRVASALMLAMLVSVWLAPSAHAQLGGGIGDAVGNVGDSVLGGGGTSGTDSGGLVGGVTDSLEGGSNGSGTDSDTTTDDGGGGGGLVGGVVGTIGKTVEKSKETVTEVTETTGDTLGTVGSGTLEGVVGTVAGTVEGTVGKVGKDSGGKNVSKQRNGRTAPTTTTSTNTAEVLGNSLADALRSDAQEIKPVLARSTDSSSVSSPVNQSLVQQIGKIAAEAVKQAAFPIALILLVVGFLMIQNRMDSKDPKLALAPVDSQHDSLSFT